MNISRRLQDILSENRSVIEATFRDGNVQVLGELARQMTEILEKGGTIFLCGNGGSAADAQHIAAEFIGRFKQERKSLPAIALTTDTSILTALANDYSYDIVFARQLEGLAKPDDLLIAISTSGNSRNIIEAVKTAQRIGMSVAGFTGQTGGKLAELADLVFKASSQNTSHIQETHITALHAISEIVEELFLTASHASKN